MIDTDSVVRIRATQTYDDPPAWARLQRQLFIALEEAADVYLAKYTRSDGSLIYCDVWPNGRDGLDDLYEAFYNLPLLYMLGGHERFLALAHFHWEAVTRQALSYGLVKDEYEVGYDQFHQSEGNQFFYLLCAADPKNPVLVERAKRFANLYTQWPNYDADKNIIRAIHTGAGGPRWGYLDNDNGPWNRFMEPFGLPYFDLSGISTFEDLGNWHEDEEHEQNRKRMQKAMNKRMGQGDCVSNLLATSLIANAAMITGDSSYERWVDTYLTGWWDRAEANDGLIPDNVGLDGIVGTHQGGNWFGAAYGWTWPLGFDYVYDVVTVAAANATLLGIDKDWAELPGSIFDTVFDKGTLVEDYATDNPPRPDPWIVAATKANDSVAAFVAPKKYKEGGWFANYPFVAGPVVTNWCASFGAADKSRVDALKDAEPQDWQVSYPFRSKGDDSHERPWYEYICGRFSNYPEISLQQSLDQVASRLADIENDKANLNEVHIHHWQNHNPITTEVLVQLSLGGPQQRYNGGFFQTCFRYFHAKSGRPGLPADVSALVSEVNADSADLELINLSDSDHQSLVVQGGFYGEHKLVGVYDSTQSITHQVNMSQVVVEVPPKTCITMRITLQRHANKPGYN